MRHINVTFLFLFFLCCGAKGQERLIYFKTNITTDTNGIIQVTEHIKILAEGDIFQRGIFRNIPTSRKDVEGKNIKLDFSDITVLQDGAPAVFKTSYKSGELEIRVGEADVFLENGEHEYNINYKATGQVGFFKDYDELYWNVTGNGWNLNIDTATCDFTSPGNGEILQASCYTGPEGATEKNCEYSNIGNHTISFVAYNLSANEGLTIAAAFPKGIVHEPPPPSWYKMNYGIVLSSVFLLLVIIYMIYSWIKYGKDPEKPAVVAQYSPPRNLSPAHIAMLNKGEYDEDFFTISVINLAVKGYLKIEDSNTINYKLTQLKAPSNVKMEDEEAAIMGNLFAKDTGSITATGKYNSKFAAAFTNFKKHFETDKKLLEDETNSRHLWIPFFLLIGFWISVGFYNVGDSFYSFFLTGGLIIISGFLCIPVFVFASFFGRNPNFGIIYKSVLLMMCCMSVAILFMDNTDLTYNTKVVSLFTTILVILFFAYRYLIRKPTIEKIAIRTEIEGFKMYLGAVEEDQLQFFNPPKMTPEHFEKMLPYALALGVEKIWGKKFRDVLSLTSEEPYVSNWYSGPDTFQNNSLHQMTHGMAGVFQSSSEKPPSRSSSSGSSSSGGSWSSGSSGGGSSGGGGGGGGGGGW
ncbi:MAG: DUF2207 domain-containing protein [Ginsengibacter sp.]